MTDEPGAQPYDDVQDPQGQTGKPQGAAPSGAFPRYYKFTDLIAAAEHGQLNADLTASMQQIVEELCNHALDHSGKAEATLTLALKFKLDKGIFQIDADPKVKLPKPDRGTTMCWPTPDNFLAPQDPKQLQMFGGRQVMDSHMTGRPVRTA